MYIDGEFGDWGVAPYGFCIALNPLWLHLHSYQIEFRGVTGRRTTGPGRGGLRRV